MEVSSLLQLREKKKCTIDLNTMLQIFCEMAQVFMKAFYMALYLHTNAQKCLKLDDHTNKITLNKIVRL